MELSLYNNISIQKIKQASKDILDQPKKHTFLEKEQFHQAAKINDQARHYNFDSGYGGIYTLLKNPFCDTATALLFYWLNSPLFYVNNPDSENELHKDGRELKAYIERRILEGGFKDVLQFVPLDFIEGPMGMLETLKEKEPYLQEIPLEMFMPVGMNFDRTASYSTIRDSLDFSGIKTFYFFDPKDCASVKNIKAEETLEELHICSNPYLKDQPKKATVADLLHLRNLKSLQMDFYIEFQELERLSELENLSSLKINVFNYDFTFLNSLTNLKSLILTTKATDLTSIQNMTFLEKLFLTGCSNLSDTAGIENLQSLSFLKIELCRKLKKLNGLVKTNITTLIFKGVLFSATALKGIDQMKLEILQIDCKKITNFKFLPIKTLKELSLYNLSRNKGLLEKREALDLGDCKIVERNRSNAR